MAEFFQNVWSLLTTENENLIRFLSLFFVFIEITVATLLITTILKIKYTKIYRHILHLQILTFIKEVKLTSFMKYPRVSPIVSIKIFCGLMSR